MNPSIPLVFAFSSSFSFTQNRHQSLHHPHLTTFYLFLIAPLSQVANLLYQSFILLVLWLIIVISPFSFFLHLPSKSLFLFYQLSLVNIFAISS